MLNKQKTKCIGILTAGGDCPGLNAAIRGVAKVAMHYGMQVIGVLDGFRGLVENRTVSLDNKSVSGILTLGGTLLGTSRDKPHKMMMGGEIMDMTQVAVANARRLQLDCLVCLGGNGTQKHALRLHNAGLEVVTLPKTIDNDVAETDITFGFDTAMNIATEAIDRLHTTATSHHRIIVCEIMGHKTGWLTLGAGIAGGADVILIPEIPYDLNVVAEHLIARRRSGKRFSIVAVAEGARAIGENTQEPVEKQNKNGNGKEDKQNKKEKKPKQKSVREATILADAAADGSETTPHLVQEPMASRLARHLQQLTGMEARVTFLGHVQRGGAPSPTDRLLCTRLGTKAGELIAEGIYNVMVAVKGEQCVAVPLEKVAGVEKRVPLDHPWIGTARLMETSLGDMPTLKVHPS